MDRRRFIQVSGASLGVAMRSPLWALPDQPPEHERARNLLVYVDSRLGQAGKSFLERIQSERASNPLIAALASGRDIQPLDPNLAGAQLSNQLAYNHVILIGAADDPLVQQAWQMEASISQGSLYVFGYGNLQGSLGYIESDRNPFLHASNVPKAPYECELITITGTNIAGISLAVDSFLGHGLVNGVVGSPGAWERGPETLLDRDPLPADFTIPAAIPAVLGSMKKIAVTHATEDEYRGVLADTGQEPVSMWRAKYHRAGQWDGAGAVSSFNNYAAGLHRRAYGNAVLLVTFESEALASSSAPLMAKAANLAHANSTWKGGLKQYAWGLDSMGDSAQPGSLELMIDGRYVLLKSQLGGRTNVDDTLQNTGPCSGR
jgi:hypothetical protein